MEFLDPQGAVIRTFTGTQADADRKPPTPDGSTDDAPRRPPEPHPAVAAGLNRLTWDLRYPGASDFPGLIMWAASSRGPIAAPGTYQVRVTADGHSETQSFAVRREPHLLKDVTDQDLREEFDLAIKVRDKSSQANEAVLLIRGIKAQIDERKGKLDAKSASVAKSLDEFASALSAIENEIYQVKLQSSQDPLNFPIKLNNKIAALQGVIEKADRAGLLGLPHAVQRPGRAAGQARYARERADAPRQPVAATAQARSDQGRSVEGPAAVTNAAAHGDYRFVRTVSKVVGEGNTRNDLTS
jgi:hypothetical protein